jgi:hypothetical protein
MSKPKSGSCSAASARSEGSFAFLTRLVQGVHKDLLSFEARTEERFKTVSDRFDRVDGKLDVVEGKVDNLAQTLPGFVSDALREVLASRTRDRHSLLFHRNGYAGQARRKFDTYLRAGKLKDDAVAVLQLNAAGAGGQRSTGADRANKSRRCRPDHAD